MESINEIIDPQAFSQQLVDESNEFIAVGQGHQIQESESECECVGIESGIKYVKRSVTQSPAALGSAMATLTARRNQGRIHGDDDSSSVVMVIDEIGHNNVQTTYEIVPQQLQQSGRSLPLSLLPIHQERHNRLGVNSPVDFVDSEISLDSLTVSPASQIVAVKQEHKLVIVHRDHDEEVDALGVENGVNININRRASIDMNMPHINVGVIDELSSDGGLEEVTLNQHHQQLLAEEHHQHQSHHPHHQYGHRLAAASELIHHQQNQRQQQRTLQLGIGHSHANNHHREALSVIVQVQGDEEDVDEDEEDDERNSADHLLSPALGVENSLEHTTYQTLTSVSNRISPPGFSPTSYATLTPIQPLPPISTMSDKFAYAGHMSGSANSSGSTNGSNIASNDRINSCGNGSTADGTSNDCGTFTSLPIPMGGAHQNSLGNLSLAGLGGVQSPYSSFDKLPSMISPPPHNYPSSPSHGLSGIVGSCDLQTHRSSVSSPIPRSESVSGSVSGCAPLSPHTELHSHSHSPQQNVNTNINVHKLVAVSQGHSHGHGHVHNHGLNHIHGQSHGQHGHNQRSQTMQLVPVSLQKQVICLSPTSGIADGVVVSDYESSYSAHQHDHELILTTSSSTNSTGGRSSQLRYQHSPTLSPHSVSAGSVVSMSLNSPASIVTLPHINGSGVNLSVDLPGAASLTPTPPPGSERSIADGIGEIVQGHGGQEQQIDQNQQRQPIQQQLLQTEVKSHPDSNVRNHNNGLHINNIQNSSNLSGCHVSQQQQQHLQNGFLSEQQQHPKRTTHSPKSTVGGSGSTVTSGSSNSGTGNRSGVTTDMEEINTKELAQRISAELKRYSIPQAIFAQRVLCRSQGTLSDLLRNPKPWSKLKSGRETFRRMFKWLQEPEFQRMSALRMAAAQIPQRPLSAVVSGGACAVGGGGSIGLSVGSTSTSPTSSVVLAATTSESSQVSSNQGNTMLSGSLSTGSGVGASTNCRRKDELHIEQMPQPKKPRLVFTDLQRRTLQAIFKETKRPSKEMQVTIARQLGLEPTTVGNFFMNARRRSMDKWRDDDSKNLQNSHNRLHHHQHQHHQDDSEEGENNNGSRGHYSSLHTTAMSPLGNFDDDGEMDLELEHHDFLDDDHDGDVHDDML